MILAGTLSESEATRRILLTAGALGLLGLVLLIATVWWWRSTRSDHPALARLEVLSTRRWGKASESERARMLAKAGPASADAGRSPEPEPVDLSILAAGDHAGFDDLREIDLMLGLHLPGALGSAGVAAATSVSSAQPGSSVDVASADSDPAADSTQVAPSDVVDPAPVPVDAALGADVAVPPLDGERAVTALGAGGAVEPADPIDVSDNLAEPDLGRGEAVEPNASDRLSSTAGDRVLGIDAARDGGATAERGSVSTIAAPDVDGGAGPVEAHDVVAYDALDEEDATSAIGTEVIDPLLQRATNPD